MDRIDIVHRVSYPDSEITKERYVKYHILKKGLDLEQAIHDATIDAFDSVIWSGGFPRSNVEYHQFIEKVKPSYCEKHGFTKNILSYAVDGAEPRDGNAVCVSQYEFAHLFKERNARKQIILERQKAHEARSTAIRDTIIKLMVHMGYYCTNYSSSTLANWTMRCKMVAVWSWAEEYVNGGNTDIIKFFKEKIESIELLG